MFQVVNGALGARWALGLTTVVSQSILLMFGIVVRACVCLCVCVSVLNQITQLMFLANKLLSRPFSYS